MDEVSFSNHLYYKVSHFKKLDETLAGTTSQGQSGPGSNVNQGVLHIPQTSRTRASLFNAVLCHTQNTPLSGYYHPADNAIGIF